MATITFIDPHTNFLPDQTKQITSTQVETHNDGSKTFRILFGKEKITFNSEEYQFIKNAVVMDMENDEDDELDEYMCPDCGIMRDVEEMCNPDGRCDYCQDSDEE